MLLHAFYGIHSERLLMENRSCLVVGGRLTQANGTAEREAALEIIGCHVKE